MGSSAPALGTQRGSGSAWPGPEKPRAGGWLPQLQGRGEEAAGGGAVARSARGRRCARSAGRWAWWAQGRGQAVAPCAAPGQVRFCWRPRTARKGFKAGPPDPGLLLAAVPGGTPILTAGACWTFPPSVFTPSQANCSVISDSTILSSFSLAVILCSLTLKHGNR